MKHTDKSDTPNRLGCHNSLGLYLFVGIGFLLMMVSESLGQLRVSQGGHLLDANRRVGSFGLNPTARPEVIFPRLMMTGNVRGGKNFQGGIPYSSVGLFNSSLSSSTLSNFRRDSTGTADLTSGLNPWRPYYDSSRSTTGTFRGRISRPDQGFTSINTSARTNILRTGVFSGQRMSMAPTNQRVLSGNLATTGIGTSMGVSYLPSGLKPSGFLPNVFNPGLEQESANPAAPLSRTLNPLQPLDLRVQPEQATGMEDFPDINQLQQRFDFAKNQALLKQQEQQRADEVNPRAQTQQTTINQYQRSLFGTPTRSNPVNRNVLYGVGTKLSRSSSLSSISGKAVGGFKPTTLSRSKRSIKLQAPPVGGNFLDYGRQLMKQKYYYQAIASFDKAIQNDPGGGVGYQDKGHAQIAAGEYISAAENINRAIELEPAIVPTRINFGELFGDPAKFEQRTSELDRLQKQTENPTMLFLKGYILYRTGSAGQAKEALIEAQRRQPDLLGIELLLDTIGGEKEK